MRSVSINILSVLCYIHRKFYSISSLRFLAIDKNVCNNIELMKHKTYDMIWDQFPSLQLSQWQWKWCRCYFRFVLFLYICAKWSLARNRNELIQLIYPHGSNSTFLSFSLPLTWRNQSTRRTDYRKVTSHISIWVCNYRKFIIDRQCWTNLIFFIFWKN